jgi:hypothetical protein
MAAVRIPATVPIQGREKMMNMAALLKLRVAETRETPYAWGRFR